MFISVYGWTVDEFGAQNTQIEIVHKIDEISMVQLQNKMPSNLQITYFRLRTDFMYLYNLSPGKRQKQSHPDQKSSVGLLTLRRQREAVYESNLGFREPSIEIKKSVKLLSKNPRNGFSDKYTTGYLSLSLNINTRSDD